MNANTEWKPALAELVGTFLLVFIGAGAGALAGAPLPATAAALYRWPWRTALRCW
jgi:glycerol uptake facilitator-like aquaporin